MKIIIFSLSLLLISLNAFPQELSTYVDNSKVANELCVALKGNSFSTDDKANKALDEILSVIGVSRNFILQSCENISNAMAISLKGIRYVFYNTEFMRDINSNIKYWGNMSILAHEIGHHINGHTIDVILYANEDVEQESLATSRMMELQADEFSGFVLAKLGATLSQTSEAISKIISDADDTYSTHPSRSKRLKAIKEGYDKAKKQDQILISSLPKPIPEKKEETKIIVVVKEESSPEVVVKDKQKPQIEKKIEKTPEEIRLEKNNKSDTYLMDAYKTIEGIRKSTNMRLRDTREKARIQAESFLEKAIVLNPENAEAYRFRGLNLINGFYEGHISSDNESWLVKGCGYLKKSIELGNSDAEDDFSFYCN